MRDLYNAAVMILSALGTGVLILIHSLMLALPFIVLGYALRLLVGAQ